MRVDKFRGCYCSSEKSSTCYCQCPSASPGSGPSVQETGSQDVEIREVARACGTASSSAGPHATPDFASPAEGEDN